MLLFILYFSGPLTVIYNMYGVQFYDFVRGTFISAIVICDSINKYYYYNYFTNIIIQINTHIWTYVKLD